MNIQRIMYEAIFFSKSFWRDEIDHRNFVEVFLTFYNFGFLDNFLQPSDKALNSIHFMT